MSAPKSVVKIKKQKGKVVVEYVDSCDTAGYYINELSRRALIDVGRYIKKQFNITFYQHFKLITGNARKATFYKVWSNAKTIYPRLEIGLPHSNKGKSVEGWYAYFQEFGSKNIKKLGLLTHAAQDNIAEIIRIESMYLKHLEGEADRLASLVDENDYEEGGDE